MDIPFNVKERPDTGLYNGKLGIWLFLASEVMLFGGLFSAYIFLRTGVDNWPAGTEYLDVRLATLNTLFLISSSFTSRSMVRLLISIIICLIATTFPAVRSIKIDPIKSLKND